MRFIYSKTFLAFAITLAVIVIALIMQVKGWLQPIEYALLQAPRPVAIVVRSIADPIHTFFSTLSSLRSVVRENAALHNQVTQLQQQQVQFDKLKTDNDLLREELKFKAQSKMSLEPCTVLSIDPQELSDAMVLSCGKEQGIQEGQAVISQGYLIGKITYVGSYNSTALLISNAQSSIDAQLSKNNTEGVVKGSFGSGMVFDLVSQNADVNAGDLVVTAGINPRIPKDILIGQVGQVLSGKNDLFKKMSVTSPIRQRAVEFVYVVKQ
ncbi:MAG TPA: rod shape-determining protein MreC [Patescibacteria group bacterium]|jgi:rod shape-determining protein MreC|nr:rod shape-determining protein MreC [Patescibacteria group bacterium]